MFVIVARLRLLLLRWQIRRTYRRLLSLPTFALFPYREWMRQAGIEI
ncbi:MAG: hypothetical protein ONB23_06550 [candidate division KSB1 bacterium]|nr:hypothetical protein [candidate division KSB1 bacterium]